MSLNVGQDWEKCYTSFVVKEEKGTMDFCRKILYLKLPKRSTGPSLLGHSHLSNEEENDTCVKISVKVTF